MVFFFFVCLFVFLIKIFKLKCNSTRQCNTMGPVELDFLSVLFVELPGLPYRHDLELTMNHCEYCEWVVCVCGCVWCGEW
jgi:hypothetical protein